MNRLRIVIVSVTVLLIAASDAVSIVCGEDEATADRYEARNDALRLIAHRRDLPAWFLRHMIDRIYRIM